MPSEAPRAKQRPDTVRRHALHLWPYLERRQLGACGPTTARGPAWSRKKEAPPARKECTGSANAALFTLLASQASYGATGPGLLVGRWRASRACAQCEQPGSRLQSNL